MALTVQQITDCRRWAGYPLLGDFQATDTNDYAYNWVLPGVWTTLYHRLANLTATEESTLIAIYLTPIATLEAAVNTAAGNLDTDFAGPWKRNRAEVEDRIALFNHQRRQMCMFIGIYPGPALQTNNRVCRG